MIEIIKVGVFDSSLEFKNTHKTKERTTQHYEVELFISGDGSSFIDQVEYPHKKGNLLFAKPNQKRYTINKFLAFYVHLNIDVHSRKLLENVPSVFKVSDYEKFKKIYLEIIKNYDKKQSCFFILQGLLYNFFDMILKEVQLTQYPSKSISKIIPTLVENSIEYIEENIDKRLTLKDISAHINYSPFYFRTAFLNYTGKTPHQYLTEKRLEKAKIYLLTTNYPISDIVEKCGFSSLSYFDINFKKKYNLTPTEFRNKKYIL